MEPATPPSPEETERTEKRNITELFANKKFLLALGLGLLGLSGIVYYFSIATREPASSAPNQIQTTVPQAADVGEPASKLEIQGREAVPLNGPGLGEAYGPPSGLQNNTGGNAPGAAAPGAVASAGVPSSLPTPGNLYDNYRYKPRTEEVLPDSLYESEEPPQRGDARRRDLRRDRRSFEAEDSDDEQARPTQTQIANLEKQKRLLALLEEYKKDKALRQRQAERDLKPTRPSDEAVSSLSAATVPVGRNGFFGLQTDEELKRRDRREDSLSVTVRAMIFGNQVISNGGRVEMRLVEPVTLRGRLIPAGTRLFGLASFSGERVNVTLRSLQLGGRIFPLSLVVYDMDGLPGIYVPGNLAVDQGRQTIGQAASGINVQTPPVYSTNASAIAAASATQAGVTGLKSLAQRRTQVPMAKLKNNYYILLK